MLLQKASLFFVLLVAICMSAVAQAQIQVNVPFNFSVGKVPMPAGRYKVVPLTVSDQAAWRVSNDHETVVILTHPVESPNKEHQPSLVFLQTGDGYSLVQFWPSERSGQDLLLKPKVTTIILAKGGKFVEIGAE
jgi:hypothetical protein